MSKSASSSAKPRVLRKLGHFERFQTSLLTMELSCGPIVTSLYRIPEHLRDSHDKQVDALEAVVADTIRKHPLLQVGVIGEKTKRPSWIQLDEINLKNHIVWKTADPNDEYDAKLNEITRQELDTTFGNFATRPGWRLLVLELEGQNLLEVMFIWNHMCTDGNGGKIFHESLLESLNTPNLPSLENHVFKTTTTAENMLPPQNVIAKYKITPKFAAATVWQELKPPMLESKTAYVSWADITRTPRKTQIRGFNVDNESTQKILSACRSHKTTLTGLLHAAAFMSLVHQLPEEKLASIISQTPLNLRRFIKPNPKAHSGLEPKQLIANYVTMMDHVFKKSLVQKVRQQSRSVGDEERFSALEEEMWSAAVFIRGEIKDKLDLGLKNDLVGLMGVVGDFDKFHRDELKKPRTASWLVSNVGVIDGQNDGDEASHWSIERSKFSLSACVVGCLFNIGVVSVKGKDLFVDLTWQDGIVDTGIADQLIADLEKWLRHVAEKA
ncbi:alcohol acetyltransferase [Fusarium solani]|uniref:Alcohol acetyltransferase n=1 Tax=Fusarium solani TaxID=169388 RepID=A0A9P9KD35_FUSSL|nr:alcohol acetyltransferase [Fusarium solani]KAH7252990.1 alcohol acetyltransferase [Fusarium solani]